MASQRNLKKLRDQRRQFFLVIYSETDADVSGYYCGGGLDLGLNEKGIEEARKLSRRFKKNPLQIKNIYCSPELRAIQMADFLHDELKGKLILNRQFADQNLGIHEGEPANQSVMATLIAEPKRGETQVEFSFRVRRGLEEFLHEEYLSVLVTHPRVALILLSWLGLDGSILERGKMYVLDLPADQGIAHIREI